MEQFSNLVKSELGISLTARQLWLFSRYEEELLEWNAKHNLTAIKDRPSIRTKHFLDSLTCIAPLKEKPKNHIVDIGTGAGFPGIPIKIMQPNSRLTLIESVGKKINFCQHIVQVLELENVEIIKARAEELGQSIKHRQKYDLAIARAVARLPTLVEYLLPFVRIGGLMLAQKGVSGPAEVHDAEHAIKILGGHLNRLHHVTLPGVAEERYIIIIEKVAATPVSYPRRVGTPTKNPIFHPDKKLDK